MVLHRQNPYLVIDEAHRFADNVISSRNDSMRFESLWGVLSHLRNLLYYSNDSVESQFNDNVQINFLLTKLDPMILELINLINELQKQLYAQHDNAINKVNLPNGTLELSFQGKGLFNQDSRFKQILPKFQQKLEEVRELTNQTLFELYHEQERMLANVEALVDYLIDREALCLFHIFELLDACQGLAHSMFSRHHACQELCRIHRTAGRTHMGLCRHGQLRQR